MKLVQLGVVQLGSVQMGVDPKKPLQEPKKVIFDHFINFVYFYVVFPLAWAMQKKELKERPNQKVFNTN